MTISEGSTVLGRKEAGVERVLVEPEKLAERVRELASQIDSWYPAESPILIGVLNGAVVFMTELMQAMTVPVSIDFMAVSSYGSSTQSSGVVQILKDLSVSIQGRDVLVVEDIVDSGLTLQYLLDYLERRNPKSLRVVALLRKVKSSALAVPVDLVGFEIPDEFVIGYGLDYAGLYRNLPYIGVLSPAAIMGN
ncbi:MAG TPA: hypoxanthine phosphoribosyltransferase [Thermomicrobiales bacterium]|nr:hypoxanthine phosphoribosyltransferase [Thermomicrobiales bacterium]